MKLKQSNKKILIVLLLMLTLPLVYANVSGQASSSPDPQIETGQTETANVSSDAAENTQPVSTKIEESDSQLNEQSNNLFATVKKGGTLMIFILVLGLLSLTIIIERIIFFIRNQVWKNDIVKKYLTGIAEKSGIVYSEDLEDELNKSFHIFSNKIERGLSLLSGIGNLAPIIGFLGTVIGMIQAFASIAAANTVNAKVVAVGIQIALITTAGGLVVAAPTTAFYYLFAHIIQNRYSDAEAAIKDICSGKKKLSDLIIPDGEQDGQE